MQTNTLTVKTTTQPLFGGYMELDRRLGIIGMISNGILAFLVLGGYTSLFGGANVKGWAIVLGSLLLVSGSAPFLFRKLHRTMQPHLIGLLDATLPSTADILDAARKEILVVPWQSATVCMLIWTAFASLDCLAFAWGNVLANSRFNPLLGAFATIPATCLVTLLGINYGCEPYRTALFTGIEPDKFPSRWFLSAPKRAAVCIGFAAYLLVFFGIVLLNSEATADPKNFMDSLPQLLIPFEVIGLGFLAAMSWLALRVDPLEQQSFSDPTAVDALQAAYVVRGEIGRGGMGVIYRAEHKLLNRPVAIKMLNPNLIGNREAVLRFRREARSASGLHHPNILSIVDFGVLPGGRCFIVMEYIEGETLADKLGREKLLSEQEALPVFISICNGLTHAHENGVLHRDLKPSNVMICANAVVKIVDFGIAKVMEDPHEAEHLTQTGQIFGTPAYMSPEQCAGKELDERSDVYSMGCLMYEVVSGIQAYAADTPLHTLVRQSNDEVVELPAGTAVSMQLRSIIRAAMEKEIGARVQSMQELATRLHEIA